MEGVVVKVLAALDETAAARTVLAASHEIAHMFAADVCGVHVLQDKARRVREITAEGGVPLVQLEGPAGLRLAEALNDDDDAIALVVGTRTRPPGAREIGSTALEVVMTAHKPVFAIPPELPTRFAIRRVLVPLEGSLPTSYAPYATLVVPGAQHVDVVILHVLEVQSVPAVCDQPQHEWEVFECEFLTRYSPWPIEHVRLETRVGRPDRLILQVARETDCNLIALAWAQDLGPGRARIVRETLLYGNLPVLLMPMKVAVEGIVHLHG